MTRQRWRRWQRCTITGLRVPEDIAIASIDNTEAAAIVRPALTTVNVPRHEMVEAAFQFLLSQREHPVSRPASMILPLELIVRELIRRQTHLALPTQS